MNRTPTTDPVVETLQQRALVAGGAGLAASVAGLLISPDQFFRSYLVGFLLWAGVALGCLALLMLHHIVGGGWGYVIRRLLEAGTRTFPLLAALFLPVVIGIPQLYEWSNGAVVQSDEVLRHKAVFLNVPFFLGRAVFYFAVWMGLSWLLNKWSAEQDRAADPRLYRRFQALSGPGLILYGLTATFAAVDWGMSLEAHWFSTIYGVLFIVGQVLSAFAFGILMANALREREPLAGVIGPQHFHDLGTLMFAFTMLWAYMNVSQFLIIWSGNLPEETPWYLRRTSGGWEYLGLFLVLFHFAVPFLILLSRRMKKAAQSLARVAAWMLAMRAFDLLWMIAPAFADAKSLRLHWLDVTAPVGIGGIWVWWFCGELKKMPLLPLGDKRFEEDLAHAGH